MGQRHFLLQAWGLGGPLPGHTIHILCSGHGVQAVAARNRSQSEGRRGARGALVLGMGTCPPAGPKARRSVVPPSPPLRLPSKLLSFTAAGSAPSLPEPSQE